MNGGGGMEWGGVGGSVVEEKESTYLVGVSAWEKMER